MSCGSICCLSSVPPHVPTFVLVSCTHFHCHGFDAFLIIYIIGRQEWAWPLAVLVIPSGFASVSIPPTYFGFASFVFEIWRALFSPLLRYKLWTSLPVALADKPE